MPLVEVESVSTKPLADGLTEVTAVIANRRVIPTCAATNVKNKITPQDKITITGGNNFREIVGMISERPSFEQPREQKRRPAELKIESVPGMQAVYTRWIVAGEGPFTVTAQSVKGGVASAQSKAAANEAAEAKPQGNSK